MLRLNSQPLTGTFDYVYSKDDAIDTAVDDWETQYRVAMENEDPSQLPLKEGKKPAVFRLQIPHGRKWARIAGSADQFNGGGVGEKREAIFETLLETLEEYVDEDGSKIEFRGDPNKIQNVCAYDGGLLSVELATAVWGRLYPSGN